MFFFPFRLIVRVQGLLSKLSTTHPDSLHSKGMLTHSVISNINFSWIFYYSTVIKVVLEASLSSNND